MTDSDKKEMAVAKRRLKSEIKKRFPDLAPLCGAYSHFRGEKVICVTRPTYPEPDPRLEDFLAEYKATLEAETTFELDIEIPHEWRATSASGDSVAPNTCEYLSAVARTIVLSHGSGCYFYSQALFDSERSRWPSHAPLPPRYWDQRQYINDQFQLLCCWVERYGQDELPDIHDISPSMLHPPESPRHFRSITHSFEPAW